MSIETVAATSASFLNGTKQDESVWNALDKLVSPSLAHKPHQPNPFINLHVLQTKEDDRTTEVLDDGSICVSFPVNFDPSSAPQATIEQIQVVSHTVEFVEVDIDENEKVNPKGMADEGGKRASEDGRKWWDFEWLRRHSEEGKQGTKGRKVVVAKKVSVDKRGRRAIAYSNGRVRSLNLQRIGSRFGQLGGVTKSICLKLSSVSLFTDDRSCADLFASLQFLKLGNDVEPFLTSLTYLSTILALLTSQ